MQVRFFRIVRLAAFIGVPVVCAPCVRAQVFQAPPQPPNASVRSPAPASSIRIEHTAELRTFTLPKRLVVKGAQACSSAQIIQVKVKDANTRPTEPALVEYALLTGRSLRLADAQCVADGVMKGSALSIEPELPKVSQ